MQVELAEVHEVSALMLGQVENKLQHAIREVITQKLEQVKV